MLAPSSLDDLQSHATRYKPQAPRTPKKRKTQEDEQEKTIKEYHRGGLVGLGLGSFLGPSGQQLGLETVLTPGGL